MDHYGHVYDLHVLVKMDHYGHILYDSLVKMYSENSKFNTCEVQVWLLLPVEKG